MSTGGGCEVAMTTRTKCEWAKLREYGELLLCEKRLPQKLKYSFCKLCKASNSV